MGKKEVKVNSFELRINHERYHILGRKAKNDKGMPGVSRSKAIKKRKEFMLQNKLLSSKSNCFIDRRIGEYDRSVLKEDQIAARMIYERRKKLKRSIYNLNDEEEITHLGQSMLDALNNPVSDSDDDDDKLDANFVEEAHFGGFLTKRREPSKTHKEIIGDLILESKRKKEEKKLERERNLDLTDKLDKEWKELVSYTGSFVRENKPLDIPKNDQYDMTVQQLRFESRGSAANKMKSPEEIAKEKKEKLEKLEQERLLRMKDWTEDRKVSDQMMSADSIDDGLELENDFLVSASGTSGDASQETEESSEVNNDKESSNCSDTVSFQSEDDMYLDLDSGSEKGEKLSENDDIPGSSGSSTRSLTSKFACVGTLDELLKSMSAHHDDEVPNVVEKLMNANHPSHGSESQSKMESLFSILLNYIDHVCQGSGDIAKIVNLLVPQLYSLAHMSPLNCASLFRDALLKKYEVLKKQRKNTVFKKYFPHISSLIILKLCGILYSTSDFHHPVVIIAMLYMSEALSHKFYVTYENLISRLFITSLFHEYVALSQRFVPEAVGFLQMVLFCASVKDTESRKFWSSVQGDQNFLLVNSMVDFEPQKLSIKLFSDISKPHDDKLKISLLDNAIKQLHLYVDVYSKLPSFQDLFLPVRSLMKNLPLKYYPASLKNSIERLDDEIVRVIVCKKSYLVFPMRRPKPLKLFEPDFDLNFFCKRNTQSKKMKLTKDLSKKCVREEKSVIREIRRDAQFLAQQLLHEKFEKDEERRNKVNKLFQDLAVQQREIKLMNKKNK